MGLEKLLVKNLNKLGAGKFTTYPLIGTLPGDFQEKLIKDLIIYKYLPMVTSLTVGIGWNLAKWYFGDQVENSFEEVGLFAQLWAYGGFMMSSIRIGGAMFLKKPIGILYAEIPWFLTRKSEKFDRLIEDHILR